MEPNDIPIPPTNDEAGGKTLKPNTKVKIKCEHCGRTREVYPSYVKRGRMKRCSRDCFNASRRKHKSIEFGGDIFVLNKFGYYFSRRTKRRLHRVIWEQHHGVIPKGYKLYFRDGNKENLSVDNLYLKEMNPKGGCNQCGGKIYARGKCRRHYRQMKTRERK